ncbi:MAG: serine hydrolase [Mycobacteriaceae bacterium]
MVATLRAARRVTAAALAAALTACGSSPRFAAESARFDQPPQLATATPLPENAVADAVARLDGLAEDLMKSSGIPGMAVAVVHGGKTLYARGFGVRDTRTGEPVDADTVFQLASLSKPIAATVVAHQVGMRAVSGWDTPVAAHLPWFALSDPAVTRMLTVADLFAHRSGLPDHAGDLLEDLGYSRREVLERLRRLPLNPFRTSYAYTNFGVTAGAEAIAVAAGIPWEDLSRQVIYGPLGMTSTSSRFADYQQRFDKAVGHVLVDGRYEPRYTRDADAQAPAGGVSASVNDMTHWLAMLLGGGEYNGTRIVDSGALLEALTPHIIASPPAQPEMRSGFYGYGFNIGTTASARMQFSHSGAFELGASTNFVMIPSADVAIVALTNAGPVGVPETLTAQFADLVQFGAIRQDWHRLYAAAFAPDDRPLGDLAGKQPPVDPTPPRPLGSYAGSYANDYWGSAVVTESDDALSLSLGPRPELYPLTHWDGDEFVFDLHNENAPVGSVSKAVFAGDRLVLEYFDQEKMGTFTRGVRP